MSTPLCLAVDGHDGSGKTTLATNLSKRLGLVYVRPFRGAQGAAFLAAAEGGEPETAIRIAEQAVHDVLDAHQDAHALVFDRLWLTVMSVLPEPMLERWTFRPPLLLCWSDLETTLDRLAKRREGQEPSAWHVHYLARYRELAARFGAAVLRTDQYDEVACLNWAASWAQRVLDAPRTPAA